MISIQEKMKSFDDFFSNNLHNVLQVRRLTYRKVNHQHFIRLVVEFLIFIQYFSRFDTDYSW